MAAELHKRSLGVGTAPGDPKPHVSSTGQNGTEPDASSLSLNDREVSAKPSSAGNDSLGARETLLMALLSLQSGSQPLMTRKCLSRDVIITTQVMTCEVVKVFFGAGALASDGSWKAAVKSLKPIESFILSAIPAGIYAVQNTLVQMSYRHLDGVTFALLNQTKLIFTAVSNYIFLRKRQSRVQVMALMVMLVAACLITLSQAPNNSKASLPGHSLMSADTFALGIVPLLLASMTSGLGSTYSQWIMQVKGRNPHVYTVEMCSLSLLMLLLSTVTSADGDRIKEHGFFHAWTAWAIIPPVTQALGGILVGFVTKHAGGVQKGFCVIFGLIIAAVLQYFVEGTPLSFFVLVALPLVVGSTYLHSMHPYKPPKIRAE